MEKRGRNDEAQKLDKKGREKKCFSYAKMYIFKKKKKEALFQS